MTRPAALALALLAGLAAPGTGRAQPLDLASPIEFTDQRFEWRREHARRWEGAYGQVEVSLLAGVPYEFSTADAVKGTTADPFLYVLDGDGEAVLARNDDGGEGRNARISFTPESSGTFVVRLRARRRGRWGECSVTLRRQPGDPAPAAEPEIRPGDVLADQPFEWREAYASRASGAYGQYRVRLQGGTLYRFETTAAEGAGGDTVLYLLDADLRGLWADDDAGTAAQSKLLFRPDADGTWYLRLRAYDRGAAGTCTLSLATGPRESEAPLLPDLVPWASRMEDAYVDSSDGVRRLRFSTAVANRGAGPLDVFGRVDAAGTTRAFQVVSNADGSRTLHPVGTFSFAGHEDHDHWHYDDFERYRLVDPASGATVAASGKVSFCLMDSEPYGGEAVPGAAAEARYTCDDQGISVGWADVYGAELEGQDIPLTGVPDGVYDLENEANPAGGLHEASARNDVARIRVEIRGASVRVLR